MKYFLCLIVLCFCTSQTNAGHLSLLHGDVNGDTVLNLTDAIVLINFIAGTDDLPVPCAAVADVNSDGVVNLEDPLFILHYLFEGGPPPVPEFVRC